MGGGRLLIFYVTNVLFVTKVISSAFCRILRQPFPRKSRTFAPNFKSALKFQTNMLIVNY